MTEPEFMATLPVTARVPAVVAEPGEIVPPADVTVPVMASVPDNVPVASICMPRAITPEPLSVALLPVAFPTVTRLVAEGWPVAARVPLTTRPPWLTTVVPL